MVKRSIQSTFFLLATAVFTATLAVIAQKQADGNASAFSSETENKDFNRLRVQVDNLLEHRDYVKARIVLQQACKRWPRRADIQCNLGSACMVMGNDEEALAHFEQALAIEPDNAAVAYSIGQCYMGMSNFKEGRIWLQKCIDSKTADARLVAEAKAALKTLPLSNDGATFDSSDKTSADCFNRLKVQVDNLLEHRDYAKARIVLQQACKRWPGRIDIECNLGLACMNMGNDEEALTHFKQALAIKPDEPVLMYNMGNCYIGMNKFKEGRIWLQNCINSKTADTRLVSEAKAALKTLPLSDDGATFDSSDKTSVDYFDYLAKSKDAIPWQSSKMPLKIFFESGTTVQYFRPEFQTILVNAFNEWTAAAGNKLSWIETDKKESADIVCKWQREPRNARVEDGKVDAEFYKWPNGAITINHATLTIFTTQKNPVGDGRVPIDDAAARNICLHEIGHVLGIFGHSPNTKDIMTAVASNITLDLTARDKNTIARLYK